MIKKLRIKFVVIIMVIVALILAAMLVMIYHFMQENIERESIQTMKSAAAGPFQPGRPGERSGQLRMPYFVLQMDDGGGLIAMGEEYFDLSDEEQLRELMDIVRSSDEQAGVISGHNLRYCRMPGPEVRYAFMDMSVEQTLLSDLMRTCFLIGGATFAVFLLISIFLSRWVAKPVDAAWTRQRQFVADASHELKTPLAVIITNAELLQSPEYDAESKMRFSESILAMSRQMRGLVESLLELARVDAGVVKTTMKPLDFSALVEDVILPFEPVYFENGLGLQTGIEGGIRLRGSEAHLRQLLDVLLDNACKYSYAPSQARVTLKRRGLHCELSVANRGEQISADDLKNIFKRFYRVDKARSMNHSYGLGLSIAQSIAEDHKGRIWAESADGVNTFHVQLPVI